MKQGEAKNSAKKLPPIRRKAVGAVDRNWCRTELLLPDKSLPLVVRPNFDDIDLLTWASNNLDWIELQLCKHGALLFRGFNIKGADDFERFIRATSKEWAQYKEAATPRAHVSGNIYTSTEYPAEQDIFLHNENSHCDSWPLKIYFYCQTPAQSGGETPIADSRQVLKLISPEIKERFQDKQILYIRNFGDGFGFPWQVVFQTDDQREVEQYCLRAGILPEWKDEKRLRVKYIRAAIAQHPRTGDQVWFNHAAFFNVARLEASLVEALVHEFSEPDLPYNTYYGDGEKIDSETLEAICRAYREATVAFPWQAHDLLMLDNMLVAHGRASFLGSRKILVGMAEPFGFRELS